MKIRSKESMTIIQIAPETRKFLGTINLGVADIGWTRRNLYHRLDDALKCLGGLQQPGGDENDRAQCQADLRTIIADIVTALGGRTAEQERADAVEGLLAQARACRDHARVQALIDAAEYLKHGSHEGSAKSLA